jgi:hypothetical protein
MQCYIDGQPWDSGPIPVGGGQSITIWTDNSWTATAGSHNLIFTADGNSATRSFSVSAGSIPSPLPDHRVWTDKATYQVGESVIIGVSPTPAIGVKYWLIIRSPNGSESRVELAAGTNTATIQASNPTGQYKVEKWGQVVTYPQPPAQLIAYCYFTLTSNVSCSGIWDVGNFSSTNSQYEPGTSLNGSLSYKISNNSNSPGTLAQVLVGIVDSSSRSYGVTCIYDGNPRTCPDYTSGTERFNLTAPSAPGTYWLVAAMDRHYSCSNASSNFPNQGDKKILTTFEISGGTKKYPLSAYVSPSGSGNVNPTSGTYDKGTNVTVTAYPNSGWSFDHWGGDASGSNPSTTVYMNSNKSVTAYFKTGQPENVKFRGTVTKVFLPDYEVRVEEVLTDPVNHLESGELSWNTVIRQSCVKDTIAEGDYVEVYGMASAKLLRQPQLQLKNGDHYIKLFQKSYPNTIEFSGIKWEIKSGYDAPGKNYWDKCNVWKDADGYLHLRINEQVDEKNDKHWYCAEIKSLDKLHFGTYTFEVIGRIDRLDSNVVLGLFNYPPPEVGPDGTNEIDIEFSKWGVWWWPLAKNLHYTVYPKEKVEGFKNETSKFNFSLNGDYTTHKFVWDSNKILFQSFYGHTDTDSNKFQEWLYKPDDNLKYIPQEPLPVLINLWLYKGHDPQDETEIIIKRFTYEKQE